MELGECGLEGVLGVVFFFEELVEEVVVLSWVLGLDDVGFRVES